MAYTFVKYSSKEIIKDESIMYRGQEMYTFSMSKICEKNKVFMEKHNEQ